jgi:hypothetical protein
MRSSLYCRGTSHCKQCKNTECITTMLSWQIYVVGNIKMYLNIREYSRYFNLISTKFKFSRQIFIKVSDIKFKGNPSRESRAYICDWTDRT